MQGIEATLGSARTKDSKGGYRLSKALEQLGAEVTVGVATGGVDGAPSATKAAATSRENDAPLALESMWSRCIGVILRNSFV